MKAAVALFSVMTLLGQAPASPPVAEPKHVAPRTSPADYQAQAKVGDFTIAADFVAHAVPTPEGTFKSEDFVVVEVAFYGAPDAKITLSFSEFALKVNDKKIPGQPNGVVFRSLTDPEWQPPKVEGEDKNKRQPGEPPPLPPKMPFPMRRAMELKVRGAAMPEGERAVPVAGLLFFPYRGKDEGIKSVELTYTGAAGSATLTFER